MCNPTVCGCSSHLGDGTNFFVAKKKFIKCERSIGSAPPYPIKRVLSLLVKLRLSKVWFNSISIKQGSLRTNQVSVRRSLCFAHKFLRRAYYYLGLCFEHVGVFIINLLIKILISYVVRIVVNNSKRRIMIDVRFILGTPKF